MGGASMRGDAEEETPCRTVSECSLTETPCRTVPACSHGDPQCIIICVWREMTEQHDERVTSRAVTIFPLSVRVIGQSASVV